MTTKMALHKDIAKLLKKYKPADVIDAVSSLSKSRRTKNNSRSKARLSSKRSSKAGVAKSLKSPVLKTPKTTRSVRTRGTASTSEKIRKKNKIRGKKRSYPVKSPFGATKRIRKSGLRERKSDSAGHDVADESLSITIGASAGAISEDRGEDYVRWFRIISGGAVGATAGEYGSEDASNGMAGSKGVREAILHLRIRDLLLSGPFKLNALHSNSSKIITFLPDGTIGAGQTQLMARWRLSDGKLEILDMAGDLQSRFLESKDGRLLTQVSDASAPSAGTTQLIPVAAKRIA
jgi:hypothetical protein